ncbi:MAG: type III pantothenate kinase [Bacteroides sp.]|nr:type III pantothenate kinase [Bacteroides sp.]MCM1413019.1 type III pantothenate kinase [Bacteroides sp.]MCM1471725.1 type III pantothenate kinase [Bacteroides sp.]
MAYYITIDQGNSAAKLALWRDETLEKILITEHLSADVISRWLEDRRSVDAAIYCSVASRGTDIMAMLSSVAHRSMRLSSDMPLPIKIDYGTPGSLGADRIAAAVGARAIMPDVPLLVVDAGTAVTYDAVSADGRFEGGNIAPGMNMRVEALHRFTARLPRVQVPRELPTGAFLGTDTASAMILGAVYGIVGAMSYYKQHLPSDTRVVMTGGWAGELSRICDFDVTVEPHLVSIGLNRILIYNENN